MYLGCDSGIWVECPHLVRVADHLLLQTDHVARHRPVIAGQTRVHLGVCHGQTQLRERLDVDKPGLQSTNTQMVIRI